jgi:hypothetical protein
VSKILAKISNIHNIFTIFTNFTKCFTIFTNYKILIFFRLGLTALCFVISALCDLFGVFLHVKLEPMYAKNKGSRREAAVKRYVREAEGTGETGMKEGMGGVPRGTWRRVKKTKWVLW